MSDATAKGELVKTYLVQYPHSSTQYISHLIFTDHPSFFDNSEQARSMVRYYRGATGTKNRGNLAPEFFLPKIQVEDSFKKDYSPYIITDTEYPILVGADAHMPFHDQDAVETFFEYGLKIKAKTIVLLGDWLDLLLMSVFTKDPTMMEPQDEIDMLKRLLEQVLAAYPKGTKIIYKYGNHEERFEDYIKRNAPHLYKCAKVTLEEQLGLGDKITIVKDKRIIKVGDLYMIHGHEYRFAIANPVNPARGLYLRAKKSALCAHFHQTSEHTETSISGTVTADWSIGALCDLHPEYMPLNKWNLGFAHLENRDNHFIVDNHRIINGKIV